MLIGVRHVRQIKDRLGRARDTCGRLVGRGAKRAADWGGRWVWRSPQEGRRRPREVFLGRFENSHFLLFRGELVNGLMKLMCLILGRVVRRSVLT